MQEPGRTQYGDEAEEITLRLAGIAMQENVLVLKYGPHLLDELSGMAQTKKAFDVVIIDTTEAGFLFSSEEMIVAAGIGRTLLEVQGALVFVKHDQAAAFVKE